jgi:hypothetical protein
MKSDGASDERRAAEKPGTFLGSDAELAAITDA